MKLPESGHSSGNDVEQAVLRLEEALAARQEIVQELRDLAHRNNEEARRRAIRLQTQLAQMTQVVKHLLTEIERLAGPPAGAPLDEEEDGHNELLAS